MLFMPLLLRLNRWLRLHDLLRLCLLRLHLLRLNDLLRLHLLGSMTRLRLNRWLRLNDLLRLHLGRLHHLLRLGGRFLVGARFTEDGLHLRCIHRRGWRSRAG